MFNKEKNKVVVVHYGNVMHYPPVINLIDCLVSNGYKTFLISEESSGIVDHVLTNPHFKYEEIAVETSPGFINAVKRNLLKRKLYRTAFLNTMEEDDIVWTTNDNAVAALNKLLIPFQDNHVLQLMELVNKVPRIKGFAYISFPIEEYARRAWKTVVPERNRAYIQKVLWKQKRTPYVLPNKPYRLDPGEITEETQNALKTIQSEERHIVLYLGVVGKDRDLAPFIEAVEKLGEEYCLYVIGRIVPTVQENFDELLKKHNSLKYLGFFNPPTHLHFIRYADVALLPYKPAYNIKSQSPLNALYCAPNKIFEYAGFGVPMVGSDVLGLREPFEKYNIGVCCDETSVSSIAAAIKYVVNNRIIMSENCKKYFSEVDIDKIVLNIISEE